MPRPATTRQKQYLRALGHKPAGNITVESASALIDKLLAEEKASGKTFPCPYCKRRFGPRPKRTKKCPSCKQTITHLSGRFYTSGQVDAMHQKDWLKEQRADIKSEVKDDWKDERSFRREFQDVGTVGYLINVGDDCKHVSHLDGLLVLIEDAYDYTGFLPPYDGCHHDTCECEYDAVSPSEVNKSTRIAESDDPAVLAKLKTRASSPVASKLKPTKSGCLGILIFLLAGLTLAAYAIAA